MIGKLAAFEAPLDEPSTTEQPASETTAPLPDAETPAPSPGEETLPLQTRSQPAVPFKPSASPSTPPPAKPQVRVPAPLGPLLGKGSLGAQAGRGPGSTPPPRPATTPPPRPGAVGPAKPAVGPSVKPSSIAPRPLGGSPLGARPAAPAAPKPAAPAAGATATAAAATAAALGVPKSASAGVSPPAAPPSPKAAPAADAEDFDPATVPIERCAAITAELRHRRSERAAVLEAHKLTEAEWAAVEGHWSEAIAGQTFRGDRKLLAAYDVAYVGAQEKLGLRVGLADHARLQIANERGTTAEVLAELGLEPSDQMRLGRVWTQRLVGDPKRMAELAAALDAARKA
jgi:hypothetical protein